MTRTRNSNTRNTRKGQSSNLDVQVVRVEEPKKTATQLANEKAEKQAQRDAERQRKQAEREQKQADAKAFREKTMTLGDTFRAVQAHASEELREGYTVANLMADYKLSKLNLKALKAILPADFMQGDAICLPTVHAAVYEGAPEDKLRNGKAIYYPTTKGSGNDKCKVWKKAQTYGFSRIELWTPAVLLRLLSAALAWDERKAHVEKRNAEVKKTKVFYILNDRKETSVSGKVNNRKTVVEDYLAIDTANVKFAE